MDKRNTLHFGKRLSENIRLFSDYLYYKGNKISVFGIVLSIFSAFSALFVLITVLMTGTTEKPVFSVIFSLSVSSFLTIALLSFIKNRITMKLPIAEQRHINAKKLEHLYALPPELFRKTAVRHIMETYCLADCETVFLTDGEKTYPPSSLNTLSGKAVIIAREEYIDEIKEKYAEKSLLVVSDREIAENCKSLEWEDEKKKTKISLKKLFTVKNSFILIRLAVILYAFSLIGGIYYKIFSVCTAVFATIMFAFSLKARK